MSFYYYLVKGFCPHEVNNIIKGQISDSVEKIRNLFCIKSNHLFIKEPNLWDEKNCISLFATIFSNITAKFMFGGSIRIVKHSKSKALVSYLAHSHSLRVPIRLSDHGLVCIVQMSV